jgi:hypothetical protein
MRVYALNYEIYAVNYEIYAVNYVPIDLLILQE